ncbi:unnamed protein product [Calypogeia fissa]
MASVMALLALVLLALVMSLNVAWASPPSKTPKTPSKTPAPYCEEIWELTTKDYEHASDMNIYNEKIDIPVEVDAPITLFRGNVWLEFSELREKRPKPTEIIAAFVSISIDRLSKLCCNEQTNRCRRGVWFIGPTVKMTVQHIFGPRCHDQIDDPSAQEHIQRLVTEVQQKRANGNLKEILNKVAGKGLAKADGQQVILTVGSVKLTIECSAERPGAKAHFQAEKVATCPLNVQNFCCLEANNCRTGWCLDTDEWEATKTMGKIEIKWWKTVVAVTGKRSRN